MKKTTIILISIISGIFFTVSVYYGLRHSRGVPAAVERPERMILEVPFIDKDIDLIKGISLDQWDGIAPVEIELIYQVMVLPWGKSLVSPITVKAFHNGEDIYFYFEWRDGTEDRLIGINYFSDACAIMFPMGDKVQPPTIMMGFLGRANIWHWKANQDEEYWSEELPETVAYSDFYYPLEEEEIFIVSKEVPQSAVNDLMAKGVGTIAPKETQNVQGRGFWNDRTWHVVLKRSLKPTDPKLDAVFKSGEEKLSAFAVWNGAKGDRGGRKSISEWVELKIK
jgi:hypothetical protein